MLRLQTSVEIYTYLLLIFLFYSLLFFLVAYLFIFSIVGQMLGRFPILSLYIVLLVFTIGIFVSTHH